MTAALYRQTESWSSWNCKEIEKTNMCVCVCISAGQCVCSRLFWEALKCMSYHTLIWRANTHTNRCARVPLVQPRNLPNLAKLCVSASAISCHRCRHLRRRGCCCCCCRRRWWSFFSCCSCCSRWWGGVVVVVVAVGAARQCLHVTVLDLQIG